MPTPTKSELCRAADLLEADPHHSVGGDALISGNSMALAVDWRIPFKERENATKN